MIAIISKMRISNTVKQNSIIVLLFIILPIVVYAETDYTIPLKHRVIQEKSLQSHKLAIGTKLTDINITTIEDNTFRLTELVSKGPAIFVFLSVECPVAQRYTMRLKRMHAEFSVKQVTIVGVYSNENDSIDDVKTYLKKSEFPFPIVKDIDGSLARHLSATMTPQAHLIDTKSILRYRGPIDDNRYITRVKHNYLKDAMVAMLNGKTVPIKETPAFGCTIHLPDIPKKKQETYNIHMQQVIQNTKDIINIVMKSIKK